MPEPNGKCPDCGAWLNDYGMCLNRCELYPDEEFNQDDYNNREA